jgi:hypothetical protein
MIVLGDTNYKPIYIYIYRVRQKNVHTLYIVCTYTLCIHIYIYVPVSCDGFLLLDRHGKVDLCHVSRDLKWAAIAQSV